MFFNLFNKLWMMKFSNIKKIILILIKSLYRLLLCFLINKNYNIYIKLNVTKQINNQVKIYWIKKDCINNFMSLSLFSIQIKIN